MIVVICIGYRINTIIAMQIRTKHSRDAKESIIRIDKRLILNILRRSIYTPANQSNDTLDWVTHHTQNLNKATPNTHFMLSGK